ncbi:type II secretion system F family protein [Defluviitalea raffinosedens]|uniref:Type II secretion system F family protein n=1 Tax=Defluviitalea raffinosedens TaxID=1450156 RepID=A0A7C8HEG9_9FIRM|nr:type II secretion system F family protein [Defluviitalea raffinosedens]KAE9633156.1 type II secretion system F family protein [Defluviitalea raffinosedens]MBM7686185.1 type IV pilus assembly protein PilC [Defluviitalea raffinosedens]
MPQFKYQAISQTGKRLEGIQDANNESEVIALLKEKGYIPIKIFKQLDKDILKNSLSFEKVKAKDLSNFCRQFYFMIHAGVTIASGLDILRKQIENKKLREALEGMYIDVQKGQELSQSMKKYENIFPQLLIHMTEVGEVSGNLDIIMDQMALHYEKESKIQDQIKNAMIYPVILGIASVLVMLFLLTFVMPSFVTMFETSGVELPGPTKVLIRISNFVIRYWYVLLAFILLLFSLFRIFSRTNRGRFVLDTIKMKIPIVNKAIEKIVSSRFASTLSILLSSGISLIEAMEVVSKVVRNKIVEDGLILASEEMRKGAELASALQRINFFPPLVISTIRIGEYSGTLDDILAQLVDFYDSEVESAIKSLITALEPLMIVVMAVLIGSIVIAMVLPMFELGQTIS